MYPETGTATYCIIPVHASNISER